MHAGEVQLALERLGTTARVLHLAAHPDDENTRLLAYLANARHLDVAYLSLTRGDGGQNLIGPELREQLGLIRTEELLAARRLDGARQFFTRAVDFGYSKTTAESLRIWGHEAVLGDVVWILRHYRPDIIVTRFEPAEGYTHGHHSASAQLAIEAFHAAADPTRFPEQLATLEPWQATRVVWNTSPWFYRRRGLDFATDGLGTLDVGAYLPELGVAVGELAARSRTMHKSQGFGAGAARGASTEYFKLLAGAPMEGRDLFAGIELGWARFPGGEQVAAAATDLAGRFDPRQPEALLPGLRELRAALAELPPDPVVQTRIAETERLMLAVLGLHAEARVPTAEVAPGGELELELEILQQRPGDVRVVAIELPLGGPVARPEAALAWQAPWSWQARWEVPAEAPLTQPFWLEQPGTTGLFVVEPIERLAEAAATPPLAARILLEVEGQPIALSVPLRTRSVDPVEGELFEPLRVVSPVYVNFQDSVYLAPTGRNRSVRLEVGSRTRSQAGAVSLLAPEGWSVEPARQGFVLDAAGDTETFDFQLRAEGDRPAAGALKAEFEAGPARSLTLIDYPHIPPQVLQPPAEAVLRPVDLRLAGTRIGYLMGAGDSIPQALRAIGYEVTELGAESIETERLGEFDSIVLGIRALNTVQGIDAVMPALFAYARGGGTVVVQYNTSHALRTDQLAPFPLTLSRGRVTDETAPLQILAPEHPALSHPHRIGPEDFEDWVQERGLYFPSQWDAAFTPLLAGHDVGEAPLEGGLLVAPVGEGWFVYTGLSFFRQLPAGVPGAYRLFVNLLSLGHE